MQRGITVAIVAAGLFAGASSPALASNLTYFTTVTNTDVAGIPGRPGAVHNVSVDDYQVERLRGRFRSLRPN